MAPSTDDNILQLERGRILTVAVNYDAHHVDSFLHLAPTGRPSPMGPENNATSLDFMSPESKARRSKRDKQKRELALARTRVRYDIQKVTPVARTKAFLEQFPAWWTQKADIGHNPPDENYPPCESCQGAAHEPIPGHESVLWVPAKRSEWEDSVAEMTAVCTSAALRKHLAMTSTPKKPFHAPLSRDYIRDRVDIDDPLHGYQIRHKTGGWLQGFIMWTNFTTWTHFFRWDSLHRASGMVDDPALEGRKADIRGILSTELESLARSGDPHGGGIVFEDVAEISLVGGLGCGEYLLRMAIDDIRERGQHKYIVLQATDSSKTFYERFGFVRVGAVCRYLGTPDVDAPLVGYRHWTHANESQTSLDMHGGPSYMMCLKLPDIKTEGCTACGRPKTLMDRPSILHEMRKLLVGEKPVVEQLGGTLTTPKSGLKRRGSDMSYSVGSSGPRKRGRPRKKSLPDGLPLTLRLDTDMKKESDGTVTPPLEHSYKGSWIGLSSSSTHGRRYSIGDVSLDSQTQRTCSSKSRRSGSEGLISLDPEPVRPVAPRVSQEITVPIDGKPNPIDKKSLMKQKVKSYPRNRDHYFNRVVKPTSSNSGEYFFVLHYNIDEETIYIVPIERMGILTGKRAGRPRYQAVIGDTDYNFKLERVQDFQVVPATMIMKTPYICQEAWDVEEC